MGGKFNELVKTHHGSENYATDSEPGARADPAIQQEAKTGKNRHGKEERQRGGVCQPTLAIYLLFVIRCHAMKDSQLQRLRVKKFFGTS